MGDHSETKCLDIYKEQYNPMQCKTYAVDLMQPIIVQDQLQVHICMCTLTFLWAIQSAFCSVAIACSFCGEGHCICMTQVVLERT